MSEGSWGARPAAVADCGERTCFSPARTKAGSEASSKNCTTRTSAPSEGCRKGRRVPGSPGRGGLGGAGSGRGGAAAGGPGGSVRKSVRRAPRAEQTCGRPPRPAPRVSGRRPGGLRAARARRAAATQSGAESGWAVGPKSKAGAAAARPVAAEALYDLLGRQVGGKLPLDLRPAGGGPRLGACACAEAGLCGRGVHFGGRAWPSWMEVKYQALGSRYLYTI